MNNAIVLEKYQFENLLMSKELVNIILPLLKGEIKEYADKFLKEKEDAINFLYTLNFSKEFLKIKNKEKRKKINRQRRLKYYQKMEHYKKVFA